MVEKPAWHAMKLRVAAPALFSPASARTRPRFAASTPSWTCRKCRQSSELRTTRLFSGTQRFNYATSSQTNTGGVAGNGSAKVKSRRGLKYAVVGAALGAGALAFSDEIKHAYAAAERSGRVFAALAVCVNE